MDSPVGEVNGAIGNGQRLKELGVFVIEFANGHFVNCTKLYTKTRHYKTLCRRCTEKRTDGLIVSRGKEAEENELSYEAGRLSDFIYQ